jgi:isoquinoline 1-oxidoreductase beta subunit
MPYRVRGRMEPGNATVLVGKDRVDIWLGDQSPQEPIISASAILGVPKASVYVHLCHLGGGYGRQGNGPHAEIAMYAAKAFPGRAVHTILTREEDWNTNTCYAAQTVGRFRAALDADGWPLALEARMAMDKNGFGISEGLDLDRFPYGVPNYRHTASYVPFHVPVAVRRNDGQPALFFRESFIDEMANAAGIDAYRYRRELVSRASFDKLYKDDLLKAMDMAAEMSGWGQRLPRGEGMGMAVNAVTNGVWYTQAQVCRMTVDRSGQAKVTRVDVAACEGFGAVNPLSFHKQIEGAINWEIDDLFTHEFVVKDGQMIPNSFNSVFTSRMKMSPREVNVKLFKSDRWVTGPTEGMCSLQGAMGNALFKATGKRVRKTPLKNQDLKWV